jgi:hypothetical protein
MEWRYGIWTRRVNVWFTQKRHMSTANQGSWSGWMMKVSVYFTFYWRLTAYYCACRFLRTFTWWGNIETREWWTEHLTNQTDPYLAVNHGRKTRFDSVPIVITAWRRCAFFLSCGQWQYSFTPCDPYFWRSYYRLYRWWAYVTISDLFLFSWTVITVVVMSTACNESKNALYEPHDSNSHRCDQPVHATKHINSGPYCTRVLQCVSQTSISSRKLW